MSVSIQLPATIIQKNINRALKEVYSAIEKSTDKLSEIVAENLIQTMITVLDASIAAYPQKYPKESTGNLASSFMIEKMGNLTPGITYTRVIVDESSAPYAMWVEEGRNAPYGLPYENVGNRDYSKSRFAGHKYIQQSVSFVVSSSSIQLDLANQIYKNLQLIGGK